MYIVNINLWIHIKNNNIYKENRNENINEAILLYNQKKNRIKYKANI